MSLKCHHRNMAKKNHCKMLQKHHEKVERIWFHGDRACCQQTILQLLEGHCHEIAQTSLFHDSGVFAMLLHSKFTLKEYVEIAKWSRCSCYYM